MYKRTRYKVKKSNVERFWEYVDKKGEDECWEWTGCTKKGYGTFWIRDVEYKNGGKMVPAHRYSYEIVNGSLSKGIPLHHTCENKKCVNPKHVIPTGSYGQHTIEHHPNSPTSINKAKTHCINGHEYTPENTSYDKQGRRRCNICDHQRIKKEQKLNIFHGKYRGKK